MDSIKLKKIKFKDVIITSFYDDHIIKIIERNKNYYEIKLLNKIKSMNLCGTYIDVGANIGNHTIFFSKETKAENIFSFEICKTILDILKINLKNNNINNVQVYDYGLSDKKTFLKLSDINVKNIGTTHIVEGIGDNKVVDLDSLNFKNISLIKIDVEGHELNVLKGANKTIKKYLPVIIAELHTKEQFNNFKNELPKNYKCDNISYGLSPTFIFIP